MPLSSDIKFQKLLALAAKASNPHEAEAAELAARRMITAYNIDPTDIPDISLYSHHNFRDNELLKKLRQEWREAHPPAEVKTHLVTYPDIDQFSKNLSSPSILFSVSGFKKYAGKKRRRASRHTYAPRNEARVEHLRQLLNNGKSRADITKQDGYSHGEISGIIRDYAGAKSADQRFQDNPKWIIGEKDGRVVYNLRKEQQHDEHDSSFGNTSARAMGATEG